MKKMSQNKDVSVSLYSVYNRSVTYINTSDRCVVSLYQPKLISVIFLMEVEFSTFREDEHLKFLFTAVHILGKLQKKSQ